MVKIGAILGLEKKIYCLSGKHSPVKKSESQNFSVFTSRIEMKTLLELFKPTLAGTCIQAIIFEQVIPNMLGGGICALCLEFVIV